MATHLIAAVNRWDNGQVLLYRRLMAYMGGVNRSGGKTE